MEGRLALVLTLAAASCSGAIGDSPPGAVSPAGDGPPTAAGAAPPGPGAPPATVSGPGNLVCQTAGAVAAPLRRLTSFEYENTLRDLFAGWDVGSPGSEVPGDTIVRQFDGFAASQGVTASHVAGYAAAAARVAALVAADVPRLLGCDPAKVGEDACFQSFLAGFARRAYRRPPTADETGRLTRAYAATKSALGFAMAVQTIVERVLQSPQLLYRLEPAAAAPARVRGYDMATRLSYLLWATMPDAALMAAAADGTLDAPDGQTRQVTRMLGDARARAAFGHLFDEWFSLTDIEDEAKDMTAFPRFSTEIARLMLQEARLFTSDLMFGPDVRWDALVGGTRTFVNDRLAAYYGLKPAPSGGAFQKVALDPGRAAGLLSLGAFTTLNATDRNTHPIRRGAFVRTRLLCDDLPAPPANVPPAPQFTGKETMRELLARHRSEPACAGCHQLIDPIGLGLENYDAGGVWRELDNDRSRVDASGEIAGDSDAAGPFNGAAELGRRLAASGHVRDCVVTQLYRFAFGRDVGADDRCAIAALSQHLATTGSLTSTVAALIASEPFQYRRQP